MSSGYDPRRPDPDLDPEDRYGFAPGSEPPTEPPEESAQPVGQPTKKRRHRRSADGEVAPEHRDRLLDREDPAPGMAWWITPLAIGTLGFLFLLGPLLVLAIKEQSATLGLAGLAGIGAVTAAETLTLTVVIVLIGEMFGIEYGPPFQAIGKLAALVLFVNGQTLLVAMLCFPCAHFIAILLAGILAGATAYGLFMLLFRLSVHESLLTVGGIVVGSWLLNFAAAGLLGVGR